MRWDREDELDLADAGGEANTATHARKIAHPPNAPKGWTGRGEAGINGADDELLHGTIWPEQVHVREQLSTRYRFPIVLFNGFKRFSESYSSSERAALFHDTAIRAYRIEGIG